MTANVEVSLSSNSIWYSITFDSVVYNFSDTIYYFKFISSAMSVMGFEQLIILGIGKCMIYSRIFFFDALFKEIQVQVSQLPPPKKKPQNKQKENPPHTTKCPNCYNLLTILAITVRNAFIMWFLAFLLVKRLHELPWVNPVSYPLALYITSVNNSCIRSS